MLRPPALIARLRPGRRDDRQRWDIQGLRALAVAAVIGDHLMHWPRGGFVGVDVFFVISGFLITGLLLREHAKTGHISFTGFYRRRVRRIMPAVVVVLSVTVVASWFVFGFSRWRSTAVDSLWSLFFVGNWRFTLVSTDYFQQDRPVSPVQHFWSLGVEEQFYLFWPWLLLAVFAVVLRRTRSDRQARTWAAAAIGVVSVASFAWAVSQTGSAPNSAYFSTLTRTWELGVGALLATAAPVFGRLPAALRPWLAWTGLLAVVASVFWVSPTAGFPAPAAAWPVLATALVIAAGTSMAGQPPYLFPLTNRAVGYVGDISFSLYLWHFPVIVLAAALFGESRTTQLGSAVVLTLAAVYTFHLVENPVRRSRWLEPRTEHRRRHRQRGSCTPVWWTTPYKVTALTLVLLVDAVLVGVTLDPGRTTVPTTAALPLPSAGSAATAGPPQLSALRTELATALAATSWPELEPSLDEVADDLEPPDVLDCGTHPVVDSQCTWGDPDATHTAVVVGDSISMTYVGALHAAFGDDNGWRVMSYGGYGCTFMDADLASQTDSGRGCPERRQAAIEAIGRIKPDVVFVANLAGLRTRQGEQVPMTPVEQKSRYVAELSKIKSAGKIVVLSAPPSDKVVESCYTKRSHPVDCVGDVTREWLTATAADEQTARESGAEFVDSKDWFCYRDRCPSFVGSIPTKKDHVHMTPEYARHLGPVILETLESRRLLSLAPTR